MPAKITITDEEAILISAAPLSDADVLEPDKVAFTLQAGDGTVVQPAFDAQGQLIPNACYFVSGDAAAGTDSVIAAVDTDDPTVADTVTVSVSHAKATHLGINIGTPFKKSDVPPAPPEAPTE